MQKSTQKYISHCYLTLLKTEKKFTGSLNFKSFIYSHTCIKTSNYHTNISRRPCFKVHVFLHKKSNVSKTKLFFPGGHTTELTEYDFVKKSDSSNFISLNLSFKLDF